MYDSDGSVKLVVRFNCENKFFLLFDYVSNKYPQFSKNEGTFITNLGQYISTIPHTHGGVERQALA